MQAGRHMRVDTYTQTHVYVVVTVCVCVPEGPQWVLAWREVYIKDERKEKNESTKRDIVKYTQANKYCI